MNIKIRKIIKVAPSNINILETENTSTSYLYPSTSSTTSSGSIENIDPNGYKIYTIGWFASSVCQKKHETKDCSWTRNISQLIPVEIPGIPNWPDPARVPGTTGDKDDDYFFGYVCNNGSVAWNIRNCTCPDGQPPMPLNFGLCTNGKLDSTPYNLLATIKILREGYYRLQMVLDQFSPSCPAIKSGDQFSSLPEIYIYVYDNINETSDTNNGTILTANFNYNCNNPAKCVPKQSFWIDNTKLSIWYPNSSGYSLAAPPPQPETNGNAFYNSWPLAKGSILQFVLKNTCEGTGYNTNPGNFSGTIRITPEY